MDDGPLRSRWGRLQAALFLVGAVSLAVWSLDSLTTGHEPAAPEPRGERAPEHAGSRRVFVLLVDSLRWQTATDPESMPNLVAMRRRGVSARVRTSRDAVTVSAVREMFTGRERFVAFGFVRDFVTGRESVESLFSQMRAAGLRAAIYPPDAFEQFAADLPPRTASEPLDDRDQAQQDAWVREALADHLAGRSEFALAHIIYSDRVAHDAGVHGRAYAEVYRHVDDLVAELDSAIPADQTLVVAGDHGHTDGGRHSLGLDVPTYLFYRGPGFAAGVELGTVPIAEHRWLLSWALELPLAGYASSRHPQALAPAVEPPPDFAEEVLEPPRPPVQGDDALFALVAAALGAACAGWILWLRGIDRRRTLEVAGWLVAGALAGFVLHRWGMWLAAVRDSVHEPRWDEMERWAMIAIVGAAVGAAWFGAARVMWTLLGALGLLLFPTVYRYGAMPALVTLWLAWLAAVLVDGRARAGARPLAEAGLCAIAAAFFLQPFAFADAGNYAHESWHPWHTSLMPHGTEEWMTASLVAKLVVFGRWSVPPWQRPLGVVAAVALHRVQWGPWHPSRGAEVVAIGVLALCGAFAPRRLPPADGAELRRVSWLAALWLAYLYAVRIPHDHYMWADFFLAALVMSARVVRRLGRERQSHHAILVLFGMAAAGWVTVAWTLHLLEWSFLYDWFSAGVVEQRALLFMPLIGARYVVPVLMARILVADVLGLPYPRRTVLTGVGVKMLGLVALMTGLGLALPSSGVYLEAVQETAILLTLALGLL
jgi:type I phosphodiesterase/nucleotide pyrophosphatase